MIKLFVRGEQIDLFKKEVFAVSKAVSKLGEFNLRHGDVSINFKIPTTAKNSAIFGYLTNINNYNLQAFDRYEGQLIEGESIVSAGYFQVLKVNIAAAYIEVRFYGGNSEWFDLIKKRDISGTYQNIKAGSGLKSYSLTEFNTKFDSDSIVASWSNEDGTFYFPTDNGGNSDKADNNFVIGDFQVGIFQHTIFKKIFDSIGVNLTGSLFNDPLYYNTLVSKPTDLTQFDRQNNNKNFKPLTQHLHGVDGLSVFQPLVFDQKDYDSQFDGSVFTSAYDIDEIGFIVELVTEKEDTYFNASAFIQWQIKLNGVLIGVPETTTVNNSNSGKLTFNLIGVVFADIGGGL
jgi:hypothetical protein